MYLLSTEEVFGSSGGSWDTWDSSYGSSCQLDYYNNCGVTHYSDGSNTNLDKTIKNASWWWLRSVGSYDSRSFACVNYYGSRASDHSNGYRGISPAFRIG